MKCPNCKSDAKEQLITLQYKEYTGLFFVLLIIGILALFVGTVLGIMGLEALSKADQPVEPIMELLTAGKLLPIGGVVTFGTIIMRVLEPYKSRNILTYVCPNCAKAWRGGRYSILMQQKPGSPGFSLSRRLDNIYIIDTSQVFWCRI